MSPIGDRQGWEVRAAQSAAMRRYALEKPSGASGLRNGMGDEAPFATRHPEDQIIENPHHSGTRDAVPFRYSTEAPRLTAAFVAQLLGQVLPDPSRGKLLARTAYGPDQGRAALLLDTLL